MTQSHYEINVAKDGKHFFATSERSATTTEDAQKVFEEISKRFPTQEGFTTTITHYEIAGKMINPASLKKKR